MIDKIIVSNVNIVEDYFDSSKQKLGYTVGHIPEGTVVFDKTKTLSVVSSHSPEFLFLSRFVKSSASLFGNYRFCRENRSMCGSIEIDALGYKYTVQLLDGIPALEVLYYGKSLVCIISEDWYCNNGSNLDLPNLFTVEDLPILHFKLGSEIYNELRNITVSDSEKCCGIRQTNLPYYNLQEIYPLVLDKYNYYLRDILSEVICITEPKTSIQDLFIQDLKLRAAPLSPISSQDISFFRLLDNIDTIENARSSGCPAIIKNFGLGLSDDVCSALIDKVKSLGGTHLTLGV